MSRGRVRSELTDPAKRHLYIRSKIQQKERCRIKLNINVMNFTHFSTQGILQIKLPPKNPTGKIIQAWKDII